MPHDGPSRCEPLDVGLSIISQHARDLGHDAVILFLDELALWLASHSANLDFLRTEGQKLAKLVESQDPNRPIPIVSFVARQRDLRDLVGEHVAGAHRLAFEEEMNWREARFHEVKLEDRNLPGDRRASRAQAAFSRREVANRRRLQRDDAGTRRGGQAAGTGA